MNLTRMYKLIKQTWFDLLARISMLMVAGLTTLLTFQKPQKQSLSKMQSKYAFHSVEISPRIILFSKKSINKQEDGYTIDAETVVPDLVMIYTWISANNKATQKYVDLFLSLGFDVLKIQTTIRDTLRPETGSQVSAEHVVKFLITNIQYSSIFVLGVSVGGYAFGELLVKLQDNPSEYGDIPGRFTGLVLDSVVDYRSTGRGLAKTLVKNKFIQNCIESSFNFFLKINHDHVTRHFERSSKAVRLDYLKIPTLFIGSKIDQLSSPQFLEQFIVNFGTIRNKCFDDSPHIQHYRYYPEEYETEIKAFLKSINAESKLNKNL